ncbi:MULTISPECIES: hypothetical protein [Pectobacterium]|uniref:hypothetical protein n=1 Tax=Pectobacterium TaxID=122277 RepID=UPI001CA5A247|nr:MULTISPECIES: hypothetical protein [Pectobacterium]MDK9422112.1 hypothetical protein [Pectobacterium carotovorum]
MTNKVSYSTLEVLLSMAPPDKLILSGIVSPRKMHLHRAGDVAIHPGSGGSNYIDATISDGSEWRNLDLNGFGFNAESRRFNNMNEIGPIMRQIENKIKYYKGRPVYYDYPVGSRRRKYIFRG